MIAVEDRQQLAELIDAADIAVRVASQLRLCKAGCELLDRAAFERSIEFLDTAIAGGQFISTGQVAGLQSTLAPLTWAADVRFAAPAWTATESVGSAEYDELVKFLKELRTSLQNIFDKKVPVDSSLDAVIDFFGRLGTILGTKADQSMRRTSNLFTTSLTTMV